MHYQPGCPLLLPQKATRKTDKVLPDELDVTVLTDEGLKDELLKHGVDAGPIVGEFSPSEGAGSHGDICLSTPIHDCGIWCVGVTH